MALIDIEKTLNSSPPITAGPLEVASVISGGIQLFQGPPRSQLTHAALTADAFSSMFSQKSTLNGLGVHGLLFADMLIDKAIYGARMKISELSQQSDEERTFQLKKSMNVPTHQPEHGKPKPLQEEVRPTSEEDNSERKDTLRSDIAPGSTIVTPDPLQEDLKPSDDPSDSSRTDSLRINLGLQDPPEKPKTLGPGRSEELDEPIWIVDIDSGCEEQETYRSVALQGVPREISYNPESNFKSIGSMGRNNPHYMYTGSEDTLEMEIDWYSLHKSRRDVIFKCRWLEALTKSDEYRTPPHRVMILWGGFGFPQKPGGGLSWAEDILVYGSDYREYESEITMFENMIWLLVSAPYTLHEFTRGFYDKSGVEGGYAKSIHEPGVKYINNKLYPAAATQKLVFKRLTEYNLSRNNIIFPLTNSYTNRHNMFKSKKKLDSVTGVNRTEVNFQPRNLLKP